MNVQLFGERCTGTNFVKKSIERNTDAQFVKSLGFKHAFPRPSLETVDLVVIVCRHPYEWLRSLYRTPWGAQRTFEGLDFDAFLRTPWRSYYDAYSVKPDDPLLHQEMLGEWCPETLRPFANAMRLRSAKYRAWLALARTFPVVIARLEDWREDSLSRVAALSEYGLTINDEFTPVVHYKGHELFGVYEPKQYESLSTEQLEWVLWELDLEIEKKLGYSSGIYRDTRDANQS